MKTLPLGFSSIDSVKKPINDVLLLDKSGKLIKRSLYNYTIRKRTFFISIAFNPVFNIDTFLRNAILVHRLLLKYMGMY